VEADVTFEWGRAAWASTIGIAISVIGVSGCVHYVPKPLDLPVTNASLDARTLSDPALRQVIESAAVGQPSPDVFDLPALTVAALYYQPDLEVARANWALARAGIQTAGERANPTVAAGPGYNSTTPAHTITPWILNLNVDFTLETAGKRGYRIDQARRLSESARFTVADTAWAVRSRVRQALLDLFSATASADVLTRQQGVQESNVTLLQRQLAAGAISTFEMTQARLTLSGIRLALLEAQRQAQDARARLATAIGVPVAALDAVRLRLDPFASVTGDIAARPLTREALVNRADVLRALSDYDASQSALQLEIARQYPDVHLGPGYQMDQSSNKWTILAPFVLPAFSRNRGPIAQADARRSVAAAQVTAVQAQAIGRVDRAFAAYQSARNTLATADQLLVDGRSLEATAQNQLAAGEISQLDLGLIQSERASRELARLSALVQVQQAVGDIEDAMQRPIDLPINPLPENPQ
jgi:outer membrane protein TolC